MSDTEKPTPDSAGGEKRDAEPERGGLSGNVISIEQARAELLSKPRRRATPARGVVDLSRMRGREVPSPVTMPPGEHAAVIVTDTPAARAHFDKRTVHPGEAPQQVHDKKVRFKTSLDPRRAKTQMSEKRSSTPDASALSGPDSRPTPDPGNDDADSLWSTPSTPPQTPRGHSHSRPSLTRPQRHSSAPNRGSPLFLIGVALAAALGAVLVYTLSRRPAEPVAQPSPTTTELFQGPSSPSPASATAQVPTAIPSEPATTATATATVAPSASEAPQPSVTASVLAPVPTVVKTARPVATPTATATSAPTASAKPTATSFLPFGKEEP